MKRRNFVKLTAIATATAMAISPTMIFAANGESDDDATSAGTTINGSGDLEGYISKEVFKVVLPTNSDANFTLDPQGLLKVADSNAYGIGAGAIYFANVGDSGTTYSNTSDPFEIINKSSYDIDVDFSVKVTLPEGVTMVASEDDLDNATTPSVYLAMKEADDASVTVLKAGENTAATKQVDAVPEDTTNTTKDDATGYLITATGSAGNYTYKYELGAKFDVDSADRASYTLTGRCDTKADWSALEGKNVTTEIVWSAKKHTDSVLSVSSVSASNNTLTVNEGFTVTKVTLVQTTGNEIVARAGSHYNFANGTLALQTTMLSGNVGGSLRIELTKEDTTKTETITIQ